LGNAQTQWSDSRGRNRLIAIYIGMEEDPRLKVLHYFIRNTPVGELKEMLRDIRTLVPAEVLELPEFSYYLSLYHEAHGLKVPLDTQVALLCDSAKVEGRYYDPKLAKSFLYDPVNEAVQEEMDMEPCSEALTAMQGQLDQYLAEHYNPEAIGRVYATQEGVVMRVFCQVVNLRNFYTGEWTGLWELKGTELTGSVTINAHYFEDGNLQMHHQKDFQQSLSDPTNATLVLAAIKALEQTLETELQTLYETLPSGSLKLLRRALPVTRTKFADNPKSKMLS